MPAIHLTVNGEQVTVETPDRLLLADMLRDRMRLTGVHLGCEHGVCGACTVLLDGEPVRSCLMLAAQAEGSHLITIEGLDRRNAEIAHALRTAFHEKHALQCGFCTPGFLITAMDVLTRYAGTELREEEARLELAGNICRCTGYVNIVEAVLQAHRMLTSTAQSQGASTANR